MILVINPRDLNDLRDKQTVLIVGYDSLNDEEVVQAERLIGRDVVRQYDDWKASNMGKTVMLSPLHNMVFIDAMNEGSYSATKLVNSIRDIASGEVEWINRSDMIMIGLPGATPAERARAREDLTRWFSPEGVANRLILVCHESD